MPHPDYFLAFEEHRASTVRAFADHLRAMPKKVAGTVQLSELCSMVDHPNGLYLFFDQDDELWYVGKATSRSFIERVPSHFDQRQDAWFNTLSARIMSRLSMETYADAHALGLSLRLVLIGIRAKATATRFEAALRAYMQPQLNALRGKRYTGEEILASYEA